MKKLIILIGIAAMFSCTKVKCCTCNYEDPRYKTKKEVICDMNKRELKASSKTRQDIRQIMSPCSSAFFSFLA